MDLIESMVESWCLCVRALEVRRDNGVRLLSA